MKNSKNSTTIFNILSTVVLQGLAFFTGPIFSAALGTSNYGVVTTYVAWVQVASIVFSLQAAGTLSVARVNYPLEDQPKFQSSVLSLATIAYFAFSAATVVVVILIRKWLDINLLMVIAGLLHGWGLYCVGFVNGKYTYEFKADRNFILSVTVSVLTIGLSLLLIRWMPKEVNYWGRILGQAVVYSLVGSVLFIGILRSGKTVYSKEYWLFTLPIALPTVFHALANIVLHQSDKVMLQSMVSNSAVGIYALACTFSGVLNTLWSALNNSWVPFYYEYTRTEQLGEMKKHARNYIELFTILTMGFMLLAREVFHFYADETFWSGTDYIPLFCIGYYFIFLYSFPVNFEFYHKKTKMIAVGTTCAAVANLVLNFVLIRAFGAVGAVFATVAAYGLQCIFHMVCAKRIKEDAFPFKSADLLPGLLAVVGTYALYMFTRDLWLIRWGFGAVLGVYLLEKIIKRKEIF